MLELIGNVDIRQRLADSLINSALAQSYLFQGPRGVGKGLTASWFAARALCQTPENGEWQAKPCGVCSACKRVLSGNHPDVTILDRIEGKASVGIDDVREGIAKVQACSFEGGWRFWIISEAERLTDEAQSALLKTLEEPPESLIMILCAAGSGALLPTVISRCRLYTFKNVSTNELESFLTSRGYSVEKAQIAARICSGSPGLALNLLNDEDLWYLRSTAIEQIQRAAVGDIWEALQAAVMLESLNTHKDDPKRDLAQVLRVLLSYYRDAFCLKAGAANTLLVNVDYLDSLQTLVAQSEASYLEKAMQAIMEAEENLQRNVNVKLLLQQLCLSLSRPQ